MGNDNANGERTTELDIDPRCVNIIYAVVHEVDEYGTRTFVKIAKYTRDEYYHESCIKTCTKIPQTWSDSHQQLQLGVYENHFKRMGEG